MHTHRQAYADESWPLEHRVTPPTPLCYIASSASILTKRGVGTPRLTVVLAETRIPFNSAQLASSRRRRRVPWVGGRGQVLCHGGEVPPARCCSRAGDPSDMPEYRLDLFPSAARDVRLKGVDGCLIPLSSPAASHKSRLIEGGKEQLELPPQIHHRTGGEPTDCQVEVK